MADAPAATSLLIAASTLLHRDDDLVHWEKPLADAVLAAAGGTGRRLRRLTGGRLGRAALALLQRLVLPGIAAHYRWRKRRIARWVEDHLRHGSTQLVLLGAGFDPLGAWVAVRHPQVRVIEADSAASIDLKTHAMRTIGLGASNLRLVACDLAAPADTTVRDLLRAGDPARPTLVVAEGVLMYLAPAQIAALFHAFAAALPAATPVLATAMTRDARGRIGFERGSALVGRWLARQREPFRWGTPRGELAATLDALGLELLALAEPAGLDPDPCPGEWLFRARIRPGTPPTTSAGD